ncbi:alpha-L-rhamnosidase C-terminal domain-containing protein [Paenibacillus aurantius]|uniref:Alpha-L-rhamnosidase C-terminal domain-containing protein n=1 Tax=Paenibacillus aurantius TaxID=2918900 RepID=A0AA96LA10_9BACL|nr:family 78 glycoside hydrolase catalytic domain [Paenibacillus aurantius]WNQ09894.1 alpha-L-rhamnosidase C-terminal domain-containing protein [Paenibacillus aurantius]
MNPLEPSKWIWNEGSRDEVNQYVEFRHEFLLPEAPASTRLYLSVDSEYAVWINGTFADTGQYDDFPQNKAYDELSVGPWLREGKNVLCILAYYQGQNSFQYIKGSPGLIYSLEAGSLTVRSGSDTSFRPSPAYRSGPVPVSTNQLGFTFEFDAGRDDGWLTEAYQMGEDWKRFGDGPEARTGPRLYKRPVPKLVIQDRCPAKLLSQGLFIRQAEPNTSVAELMQHDYLSYRLPESLMETAGDFSLPSPAGLSLRPSLFRENGGVYLLLDLGREECGLLDLELEADAGVLVDIAYGEHLEDLRVRAEVRGKHFATRYQCGEGRQTFTHCLKRWAGRYLQVHISGVTERFVLYYAGLRAVEYPVEAKGEFYCPDRLHQQIEKVAVRTLHLCMHEHYEDTPWREQALYAMDARNQALCGYYGFGEYELPGASFQLLEEGLKEDGFLEICAPAENVITIPSFSFLWVVELEEHLLYSGRFELAEARLPAVQRMMDTHIGRLRDGLLANPAGSRYWNFYDWASGMDNWSAILPPGASTDRIDYDAPLNLFFVMALDAAASLLKLCGRPEASERYSSLSAKVKAAIQDRFWDPAESAYRTYRRENGVDHYAELTQALALCAKVCPEPLAGGLRERLAKRDNGWVPVTLSYSLFKFKALLEDPERYGPLVFHSIADDWGGMLYKGATSFWETKEGADAFDRAGSLCHGWSAIPVYFYYAYLLGITPVEPGFKVFRFEPARSVFHQASGVVPTPYGPISVKWEATPQGLHSDVTWPEGIVPLRKQ